MFTSLTLARSNAWYRVRSAVEQDPETQQNIVRFVHPVGAGQATDGWMKPNPEDEKADSQGDAGTDRVLSLEEIEKHSKRVSPDTLSLAWAF